MSAQRIRRPIAVLLSRFPLITETFILREVIELERQGQPVVLVPMMREKAKVVHEEARPWMQRALFTPFISLPILSAFLKACLRRPATIARLLFWITGGALFRPATLLKSVALLPKSALLAERLQEEGVTHIHAHFATHPTTMARIISELSGIPFSFTVHAHDIFVERTLLREKIRDARFIRSISHFNRGFLQSLYGTAVADKTEVVHVGIEPEKYAPQADKPRRLNAPLRVISIAALKPYKGVPYLVRACGLLISEGIDLRCDIIGLGPMRGAIRRAIVKEGLHGRVRLRGALPQHVVADEIRRSDLFVLPSIVAADGQMEGIPVALMEAMAAGKPVIATAISGIPELVEDQRSGFLVDPANPRQLADAMHRLLTDGELREKFAREGCEKVRREFDLRACVTLLLDAFDRYALTDARDDASIGAVASALPETCGLRRVAHGTDAIAFELCCVPGGEIVIKQHLSRPNESRPPEVRAADEWRLLQRISEHFRGDPQLGVPRPIRFDEAAATVTMSRAEGAPLSALIREARGDRNGHGYALRDAMGGAGAWLHRFQELERADGLDALASITDRALHDARAVGTPRSIRERIAVLREEVEERDAVAVSHHGDFWPGNIYANGRAVRVIDFEGYTLSLPSHDVTYFLLHVSLYLALRGHRLMDLVRESFFDSYGQTLDPSELELCRLATALQLAARDDRSQSPTERLARWRVVRKELSR
jgi:colanic acid/amylovoran biosynthesis glycosyltransferase